TVGQGQLRRLEHRRPDDSVQARDVLADHVQLGRPAIVIMLIGKPRGREIVRQRVEPDPRSLFLASGQGERKWYCPGQPRTRDRDVLEALIEQCENLI